MYCVIIIDTFVGFLEQSTILGIVALKTNPLVRINNRINMHYAVCRIID